MLKISDVMRPLIADRDDSAVVYKLIQSTKYETLVKTSGSPIEQITVPYETRPTRIPSFTSGPPESLN